MYSALMRATDLSAGGPDQRKGAMMDRVQRIRLIADTFIAHVNEEIAPYTELDESYGDAERAAWVDEVNSVKSDLHEYLAEVRALMPEFDDAEAAKSEAEDLQSDIETAMDEIDAHLQAIGAAPPAKSSPLPRSAKSIALDIMQVSPLLGAAVVAAIATAALAIENYISSPTAESLSEALTKVYDAQSALETELDDAITSGANDATILAIEDRRVQLVPIIASLESQIDAINARADAAA